jgi:hypothetical protein
MFMSKTDNAAQIDQSLDTEFVSLPRLAALSKVRATRQCGSAIFISHGDGNPAKNSYSRIAF